MYQVRCLHQCAGSFDAVLCVDVCGCGCARVGVLMSMWVCSGCVHVTDSGRKEGRRACSGKEAKLQS